VLACVAGCQILCPIWTCIPLALHVKQACSVANHHVLPFYGVFSPFALQAFIPDAKDALEEVDVLKKETLSEMDKQMGKKEASPG
jgi:hypothetical protein